MTTKATIIFRKLAATVDESKDYFYKKKIIIQNELEDLEMHFSEIK